MFIRVISSKTVNHRRLKTCGDLLWNTLKVRLFLHFCETFAAIYRPAFRRLERNLARLPAVRAYGIIHFAGRFVVSLTLFTAFFASSRFVGKTFFRKKLLFASCPYKFFAAFLTDQSLVLIHNINLISLVPAAAH